MNVKIVGAIDLFPTWYPENGPLFVGNLGYLTSGSVHGPYEVCSDHPGRPTSARSGHGPWLTVLSPIPTSIRARSSTMGSTSW